MQLEGGNSSQCFVKKKKNIKDCLISLSHISLVIIMFLLFQFGTLKKFRQMEVEVDKFQWKKIGKLIRYNCMACKGLPAKFCLHFIGKASKKQLIIGCSWEVFGGLGCGKLESTS